MIDTFALAAIHLALGIVIFRLLVRAEDGGPAAPPSPPRRPFDRRR